MKKIILMTSLLASMGAQAAELGINASRDMANTNRTGYGLSFGQKFGAYKVTAGFDRYTAGNDLDKYSIVGSYDVTKIGSATLAVKAGGAYLNQKTGNDGYAALVGAGVSFPLTSTVSATVDYRYQYGQTRVNNLNGSTVSAGLKYSF